MSNYPEGNMHPEDPRSPLYDEPDVYICTHCNKAKEAHYMRTESCCDLCVEELDCG